MFLSKYCIKKAWLLLPMMLLSGLLHAQEEDDDAVIDTVITSTNNYYFLQKTMQESGGGPDTIGWKRVPDTLVKTLKSDENFWYVNFVFKKTKGNKKEAKIDKEVKSKKNKTEERGSFILSPVFQTLLWILIIGGFATFVFIYLANSNTGLFRRKNTTIRSNEEMEFVTDNIFEINYQREIDKAVVSGNYRFAVRLMFLRLLKNLSDTKAIQYTPDRTNFDYLMQLQSTAYYKDFFKLTRSYEYSWYGHFDIDTEKFSWIRKDFESFDQKLK